MLSNTLLQLKLSKNMRCPRYASHRKELRRQKRLRSMSDTLYSLQVPEAEFTDILKAPEEVVETADTQEQVPESRPCR